MEVGGYRIFYIDQSEDIDSIINLLETTTAQKLALVIHSNQPLLSDPAKFNLIKRKVRKSEKKVVFVNPDPRNIEIVDQIGFDLYPGLTALKDEAPFQVAAAGNETEDSQPEEREDNNRQLIFTLIGIILILILAWVYFVYPIVTINIKPVIKNAQQQVVVKGSLGGNIDREHKILPLHKFEVTLTDEDSINTTGSKLIGKSRATGIVRFINEQKKDIIIPAGTKLETETGMGFETLKKIKVPKLKVDYLMDVKVGMKAGQVEVKIQALKKGSNGNVNTGKINEMKKNIKGIHVINPEPTRNGLDERLAIVSKNDINRVENNLREKIKSKLLSKIYQKLSGNYRVIVDQIEYSDIDFEYNHQVGDIARRLKGTGTLVARGYLLRNNELNELVTGIFQKNLKKNYHLLSSGINVNELTLAEKEDDLYNILLELEAPVVPEIKEPGLIQRLAGLKIDAARELLSKQGNIENYKINCKAASLPKFGFAIRLKVAKPNNYQVMDVNE